MERPNNVPLAIPEQNLHSEAWTGVFKTLAQRLRGFNASGFYYESSLTLTHRTPVILSLAQLSTVLSDDLGRPEVMSIVLHTKDGLYAKSGAFAKWEDQEPRINKVSYARVPEATIEDLNQALNQLNDRLQKEE